MSRSVGDKPSDKSGIFPADFSTYWGFQHSPFHARIPVPGDFLLENQRALANRLMVAAQEGAPLVVIKGRDGSGMTTLARWLYDSLPVSSHMALLLAPGAAGVEPSALSSRILDSVKSLPGAPQGTIDPGLGLREQLLALAPAFDLMQRRGKRIAVILDNASFLSGEPWSAYFLAMLRQGELVDPVIQFFLFGCAADMDRLIAGWSRALIARSTSVTLPSPSDDSMHRWLRNRLVLAGLPEAKAVSIFSPSAVSRAVRSAQGSLTRLGRIAGAALIEAFLAGRRIVERIDVDAATNESPDSMAAGDHVGIHRKATREASDQGDGSTATFDKFKEDSEIPRLIDLVKSN
jgi:type II secretory pathway predicted ATPase ExeA